MNDIQKLFKQQAEWQKQQKLLSWAEKIHRVEAIRESILQLRRSGPRIKSRDCPKT